MPPPAPDKGTEMTSVTNDVQPLLKSASSRPRINVLGVDVVNDDDLGDVVWVFPVKISEEACLRQQCSVQTAKELPKCDCKGYGTVGWDAVYKAKYARDEKVMLSASQLIPQQATKNRNKTTLVYPCAVARAQVCTYTSSLQLVLPAAGACLRDCDPCSRRL